ncbi:MAG TPA: hypothetical protein VMU95_10015 [Trebonia sp.]|nr:hypothetical protein [Trebonia sp.]
MNWLKVAAVVIGALIAFLIVGEIVHVVLALLGYVLIAALIAGGGYVAYKVVTSSRRREVKDHHRDRQLPDDHYRQADYQPPASPRSNVDDELNRLRRDMGH